MSLSFPPPKGHACITQEQQNQPTKRNQNKPTRTSALKPETHNEHSTLQHLSISFPSPREHACIAVVNGAFQIQHLSPPFDLRRAPFLTRWKFSSMASKIAKDGSSSSTPFDTQSKGMSGLRRTDTQGVRGVSILPNPNLIALIPHTTISP
jgi:hypothetical protein